MGHCARGTFSTARLLLGNTTFRSLHPDLSHVTDSLSRTRGTKSLFHDRTCRSFRAGLSGAHARGIAAAQIKCNLDVVLTLLMDVNSTVIVRQIVDGIRNIVASLQSVTDKSNSLAHHIGIRARSRVKIVVGLFGDFLSGLRIAVQRVVSTTNPLRRVSGSLCRLARSARRGTHSRRNRASSVDHSVSTVARDVRRITRHSRRTSRITTTTSGRTRATQRGVSGLSSDVDSLNNDILKSIRTVRRLRRRARRMNSMLAIVHDVTRRAGLLTLGTTVRTTQTNRRNHKFTIITSRIHGLTRGATVSATRVRAVVRHLRLDTGNILGIVALGKRGTRTDVRHSIRTARALRIVTGSIHRVSILGTNVTRFARRRVDLSGSVRGSARILRASARAAARKTSTVTHLNRRLIDAKGSLHTSATRFHIWPGPYGWGRRRRGRGVSTPRPYDISDSCFFLHTKAE